MAWEFTQWRLNITVEKQLAQFDHQTNYFFRIVHVHGHPRTAKLGPKADLPTAPCNFSGISLMYFNISKVDHKVKT